MLKTTLLTLLAALAFSANASASDFSEGGDDWAPMGPGGGDGGNGGVVDNCYRVSKASPTHPNNRANPGDTLRYRITVRNACDVPLTRARLVDTLPAHVAYLSSSASCSHSGGTTGGTVSCTGALAANATGTVEILVRVAARPWNWIQNRACLSDDIFGGYTCVWLNHWIVPAAPSADLEPSSLD